MREPENSGRSVYNNTSSQYSPEGSTEYIGVPQGYKGKLVVPTSKNFPQGGTMLSKDPKERQPSYYNLPRYQTGDEFELIHQSPAQIREFQTWARRVGMIGPNTRITDGVADQTTINAYRELLGFANINGLDSYSAMQQYTATITADESEKRIPRVFDPPDQRRSSAKDIKNAIRATAMEIMGEEPSEEQVTNILLKVRAAEDEQYAGQLASARESFEQERYYNEERGAPALTKNEIREAPDPSSIALDDFMGTDAALKWSMMQGAMGILRTFRGG